MCCISKHKPLSQLVLHAGVTFQRIMLGLRSTWKCILRKMTPKSCVCVCGEAEAGLGKWWRRRCEGGGGGGGGRVGMLFTLHRSSMWETEPTFLFFFHTTVIWMKVMVINIRIRGVYHPTITSMCKCSDTSQHWCYCYHISKTTLPKKNSLTLNTDPKWVWGSSDQQV